MHSHYFSNNSIIVIKITFFTHSFRIIYLLVMWTIFRIWLPPFFMVTTIAHTFCIMFFVYMFALTYKFRFTSCITFLFHLFLYFINFINLFYIFLFYLCLFDTFFSQLYIHRNYAAIRLYLFYIHTILFYIFSNLLLYNLIISVL